MQKIKLDKQFFVFIILSAVLIAELFIILPWGIGTISKTGKAVKRLKQKIETTKTEWPKRQNYLAKIDDLKKEIAKNKNKIIASGHESKLISFISKNSQKYKIRIKSITPLEPYPVKDKKFNYTPFRIEAEGGFHDLGNFLAFLQKDNYFFELKELTLAGYRPNKINILLCGLEER
jgi:Tfp pilus assembly protein PilO